MAQKRYLDKKISLSEKVADLSLLGQVIYTWSIPHADDFGLLQASPRTIKAQVIPLINVSTEDVEEAICEITKVGLWKLISIKAKLYYEIIGFANNQKFRLDINPWVIFPFEYESSPKENWNKCYEIIKNSESGSKSCPDVTPRSNSVTSRNFPNHKIREGKIREDSNINTSEEKPIAPSGAGNLKSILEKKEQSLGIKKAGGQTQWQDAAARMAKALNITLLKEYQASWFKIFKEADTSPMKNQKIQVAYSWLADNERFLEADDEGRIKMFFWVYQNGIPKKGG